MLLVLVLMPMLNLAPSLQVSTVGFGDISPLTDLSRGLIVAILIVLLIIGKVSHPCRLRGLPSHNRTRCLATEQSSNGAGKVLIGLAYNGITMHASMTALCICSWCPVHLLLCALCIALYSQYLGRRANSLPSCRGTPHLLLPLIEAQMVISSFAVTSPQAPLADF